LTFIDEFAYELLTEERVCDIILPRLQKRQILEENGEIGPRKSRLLAAMEDGSEDGSAKNRSRSRSPDRSPSRSPSRSVVEVAAGRRPMLVLDMFLAVLRGLYLVLLHPINQKVVWTSMEHLRQLCIYDYISGYFLQETSAVSIHRVPLTTTSTVPQQKACLAEPPRW
jgi:hypothetical protein